MAPVRGGSSGRQSYSIIGPCELVYMMSIAKGKVICLVLNISDDPIHAVGGYGGRLRFADGEVLHCR
jgi:hypothetical protein